MFIAWPVLTNVAGFHIDAAKMLVDRLRLQVSEIAFNRSRRYAVLNLSFACGNLCGYRGTMVVERANGRWRAMTRNCRKRIRPATSVELFAGYRSRARGGFCAASDGGSLTSNARDCRATPLPWCTVTSTT